jgi:serine/threonine protein kinase
MGSPGYMSPEQADGKTAKAGPEADVFALGVILYEILTGKSPFQGETEREALAHTVNLEPKPPSRALLVGRSLRAVSRKTLHKDPSQRYRSAGPLADDIRSYNEGQSVQVARPSPVERLFFWIRREPVRAGLTLGVAMAALTGLGFVGIQIWIDHRIADKTMENIATSDRAVAELDYEIAEWKTKLNQPGADRAQLQHELKILKSRRIIRQIQALNAIRSVGNLRFIRADSELNQEGRRRLFALFESSVESVHSMLLLALADSILEEIQEGVANFPYSAEDQAQLRAYRERARIHQESALEHGDLPPSKEPPSVPSP